MGILDVLESLGYEFEGRGNYRRCVQFDSLVINISKDLFYWNSKNFGGNTYNFLITIENKSSKEAMQILNGFGMVEEKPRQVENKVLRFPTKHEIEYFTKRANYYHRSLLQDENKIEYWHKQGINEYSIKKFQLGWAYECPVVRDIDSFTIPYLRGSDIIDIKHRLNINSKDKYRHEKSGVDNYLFNINGLYREDGLNWPGDAILLEGEKKAIVFNQHGFRTASIGGANAWKDDFLKDFHDAKIDYIYVMLDPGMEEQAERLASRIKAQGKNSKAVFLPDKPDDFIIKGNTANDVLGFVYGGV
jgi:hypothetical protein